MKRFVLSEYCSKNSSICCLHAKRRTPNFRNQNLFIPQLGGAHNEMDWILRRSTRDAPLPNMPFHPAGIFIELSSANTTKVNYVNFNGSGNVPLSIARCARQLSNSSRTAWHRPISLFKGNVPLGQLGIVRRHSLECRDFLKKPHTNETEKSISRSTQTPNLLHPATASRRGEAHRLLSNRWTHNVWLAQPRRRQRRWRTRQTTSESIGVPKTRTRIFA